MSAANQAFRGASLYAGIFDDAPSDAPQQDNTSKSGQEASATGDSAAGSSSKSTGNAGWSASLRFAPRRTGGTKPKSRPNAAFVASFAPVPPGDKPEQPSKANLVPSGPQPISNAVNGAGTTSSQANEPSLPSMAGMGEVEHGRRKAGRLVETSDLKLTALALPQSADDGWLAAELDKYRVDSAPPYVLAPEELERDKALARYPERGGDEWDEAEADEDVNGFFATNAGKRARKKKKRKRGTSPVGPSLNGEYDPRVPNDYLAYKQVVYDRRCAQLDQQKWQQEYDDELERNHQQVRGGDESTKLTGEEAYARRIAMSANTGEEAYLRRMAMSQPPAPGPPPRPPPSLQAADVDARQNAAAIAARLAALAPPPDPHQPPPQ